MKKITVKDITLIGIMAAAVYVASAFFANSNTNGNRQHSTAYGECNVPVIWYASGSNTGRTCGWDRFYVF